MSIEAHYKQTVTIKQWNDTLDAFGYPDKQSANWDAVVTSAPCVLQPLSSREEYVKGKETVYRDAICFTAYNSSVTEEMRATIDSVEYRIIYVKNPNSRGHHMEIGLLKVV